MFYQKLRQQMLIILAIFAIITIFATIFGGCGTPYYGIYGGGYGGGYGHGRYYPGGYNDYPRGHLEPGRQAYFQDPYGPMLVCFSNQSGYTKSLLLFRPIRGKLEPELTIGGEAYNRVVLAPHTQKKFWLQQGKIIYEIYRYSGPEDWDYVGKREDFIRMDYHLSSTRRNYNYLITM